MTKITFNKKTILTISLTTILLAGLIVLVNPSNTALAADHPITGTGTEVPVYQGIAALPVDCNRDSNVVAWVSNNGGTVGQYQTIANDIEANLGVTTRNVNLVGPVPDCIVKLVVTHAPGICLGDLGVVADAAILDWVNNQGGELLILEEHSVCGGGSADLTAAFGAIRQGNTATSCGVIGETYDATEFDATHPIMAGVKSFNMQCGTDFVSDGTLATVVTDNTNGRPIMLAGPVNSGCVVINGDSNYMADLFNTINIADTRIMANNVFAFLNECAEREPEIDKTLEGPDEIGIYLPRPTEYIITISYTGPAALVRDTVPAEFEILQLQASNGIVNFFDTSKGKGNSANRIEWDVPAGSNTLTVEIQTVASPGHGKKTPDVFKPTSCGPLPINDGATAFEVDENGNTVLVSYTDPVTGEVTLHPVIIVGPSNSLEVDAVAGAKPCSEG